MRAAATGFLNRSVTLGGHGPALIGLQLTAVARSTDDEGRDQEPAKCKPHGFPEAGSGIAGPDRVHRRGGNSHATAVAVRWPDIWDSGYLFRRNGNGVKPNRLPLLPHFDLLADWQAGRHGGLDPAPPGAAGTLRGQQE